MIRSVATHTVVFSLMLLVGCATGTQEDSAAFDTAAVDAWVDMWNSYDLDMVDRLFVSDSTVTYLSSEREGVITGIDSLREHHRGFGFANGGTETQTELWLEDLHISQYPSATVVAGTWYFRRGADEQEIQRGPVTLVYVPIDGAHRIAHAHFGNY